MSNIVIRAVEADDIKNITVLKQQVWISTYAVDGVREEFSNYVLSEFTPEKTSSIICDHTRKTFVALSQHHLVGCIEIDFKPYSSIIDTDKQPEIRVLYVLESFHGKNIGSLLLQKAIDEIQKLKCDSTWLTVYVENHRAIDFYLKKGFEIAGTTYFEIDENKYENLIMKLAL